MYLCVCVCLFPQLFGLAGGRAGHATHDTDTFELTLVNDATLPAMLANAAHKQTDKRNGKSTDRGRNRERDRERRGERRDMKWAWSA